ncbi:type II toxin-antitoxin system death-on-curing family toxin [Smaragdicoccus niigatensis]|uniref:type II toxin-antitoxin system death-on-curing family toxin n=1 Tax=Smaragdicoccus niigatensis TaxID=359359 RepID=UPI000363004C|nr:type II toxin-antitoxin system death-on-curing family toxin [Smaragdicoccus niigatensis]
MIYLSFAQAQAIADIAVDGKAHFRDIGLLHAALERPKATVFGEDAYPDVFEKAAALMHSIVRSHPLIDGNKRFGITATAVFLGLNGVQLGLPVDEAEKFVVSVADGTFSEVSEIAARLRAFQSD